jgi:hypothetical protein
MKFTKESLLLMSFFNENPCLKPISINSKSQEILHNLYNELKEGFTFINNNKNKYGETFYNISILDIDNINQIPKPSTFPPNAFPDIVRDYINDNIMYSLNYTFNIYNREIKIFFLIEGKDVPKHIKSFNNYIDYMLVWLYVVNLYSSNICAPKLKIYIYMTDLLKVLPNNNVEVLSEKHVNTAFTRTCPIDSEIVIFRKEEWFKAFIHETFHNFGLDFSGLHAETCNPKILSIFPLNSEVNVYESYTEFWARIINIMFCSYIYTNINNNYKEEKQWFVFKKQFSLLINIERIYSYFQMIKIMRFMDIHYKDLYEKTIHSEYIRDTLYKEKTSVFSYYVVTLLLLNNPNDFLKWCSEKNKKLLQFKQTKANLNEFCLYIEKKYKMKDLLKNIDCIENFYKKIESNIIEKRNHTNKINVKNTNKKLLYIMNNLRMTVCELG